MYLIFFFLLILKQILSLKLSNLIACYTINTTLISYTETEVLTLPQELTSKSAQQSSFIALIIRPTYHAR